MQRDRTNVCCCHAERDTSFSGPAAKSTTTIIRRQRRRWFRIPTTTIYYVPWAGWYSRKSGPRTVGVGKWGAAHPASTMAANKPTGTSALLPLESGTPLSYGFSLGSQSKQRPFAPLFSAIRLLLSFGQILSLTRKTTRTHTSSPIPLPRTRVHGTHHKRTVISRVRPATHNRNRYVNIEKYVHFVRENVIWAF